MEVEGSVAQGVKVLALDPNRKVFLALDPDFQNPRLLRLAKYFPGLNLKNLLAELKLNPVELKINIVDLKHNHLDFRRMGVLPGEAIMEELLLGTPTLGAVILILPHCFIFITRQKTHPTRK